MQVWTKLLLRWKKSKDMHKRPVPQEPELCIVCQKDLEQKVMKVSSDDPESVDSTRQLRWKLQSDTFWNATDRFTTMLQADSLKLLV